MSMTASPAIPTSARPEGLDLVLYPNPPLGRHGMAWVLAVSAAVLGAVGIGFLSVGAWPVTGFLGLDLLGLWLALRLAAQRARRSETIRLEPGRLVVRRLGPDARLLAETVLDPSWVQVVLDERRRHDPQLALRTHGRLVPVGSFLAADERRELARELRAALALHRNLLSR